VSYDATEARIELLAEIAQAGDELGEALAALGEAYELLDEASAERLEERLFAPVQQAYGRVQRTHAGFAQRSGLAAAAFVPASPGHPSQGVGGFLQAALEAVAGADQVLAALQDSMRLVDVGDAELRGGVTGVRQLLADVPQRGREFLRTLGR
jgi:hypothetical protein